ncbi:MAG TPA: SDR family oxidoreductase [Vicinamibacteria bacterium]|nr:SDR family oxidoreductase [Vicinamibacteria bacterium]
MSTVLITGSSTGIGLATAVTLGRAGHRVYATMWNPDGAPELGDIAAKESLPIEISRMDVDSTESVAEAVGQVLDSAGSIEVLVNNAGVPGAGPVAELPLEEFKKVMETNFFGALRCIQAVLPAMTRHREGCIVNVSSVAGRLAGTPMAAYAASKFALEAASEALAQEVKPFNIRVALVEPGVIATPIFGKYRDSPKHTPYPGERRIMALFQTSLEQPVSPFVVAERIKDIVSSGSWRLRHPVGPDAESIMQWRADMSDEAWVDWWAVEDDEIWCAQVERDLGIDVRPHLKD